MSCSFLNRTVSNMDSRMRPQVPMAAKMMVNTERIFSVMFAFGTSRPRCRNQWSDRKERSRDTVVTQHPAMNRGFNLDAPTSLMYAMFWPGLIEE